MKTILLLLALLAAVMPTCLDPARAWAFDPIQDLLSDSVTAPGDRGLGNADSGSSFSLDTILNDSDASGGLGGTSTALDGPAGLTSEEHQTTIGSPLAGRVDETVLAGGLSKPAVPAPMNGPSPVTAVPEPSAILLALAALVYFLLFGRRRRVV